MISFIIPAHNASKYIERAFRSIENNAIVCDKLEDVEIIIVENGSTDDTFAVASMLVSDYNNAKVVRSAKGVSAARNRGIETAKGKWIFFLDADDYLLDSALEKLIEDIEDNRNDWILYGHIKGTKRLQLSESEKIINANEIEKSRVEFISNPTKYLQVWAKLFKKDIIIENGLRFDEEIKLAEDSDFSIRYSSFCKRILISNSIVYNYSIDNISTLRSINDERVNEFVFSLKKTKKFIAQESEIIKRAYAKYIMMHFNIAMVTGVFANNINKSIKDKNKTLKETVLRPVFQDALKIIRIMECSSLRMVPILLIKLKCYRLAGLIYIIRAKKNAKESNNV